MSCTEQDLMELSNDIKTAVRDANACTSCSTFTLATELGALAAALELDTGEDRLKEFLKIACDSYNFTLNRLNQTPKH